MINALLFSIPFDIHYLLEEFIEVHSYQTLQLIPPKDPLLQKHIKTYYLHSSADQHFKQTLVYYPNYNSTLNIYKHSKVTQTAHSRTHTYFENANYLTLLVGKINKSRSIQMIGPLDKFGIVFHPLGLNHFITSPLSNYIEDHFSFFDGFDDTFSNLYDALFSEISLEEKRDLLDHFFLSQYRPFNAAKLKNAIQQILTAHEPIRVSHLAESLNISRKTLLRYFKKHLSYSVEEYIAVVKFRMALIHHQEKEKAPKLTDIAYESTYYDQSDFNRQLKLRSGLSPKQLFAELQTIEKGLFWKVST